MIKSNLFLKKAKQKNEEKKSFLQQIHFNVTPFIETFTQPTK